jgi:hypothetical protein
MKTAKVKKPPAPKLKPKPKPAPKSKPKLAPEPMPKPKPAPKSKPKPKPKPKESTTNRRTKKTGGLNPYWIMGVWSAIAVALVVTLVHVYESTRAVLHSKAREPASSAPLLATDPLRAEFEQASKLTRGERVSYWSGLLLRSREFSDRLLLTSKEEGRPLVLDSAPLVPPKYNCTTFVETALALSRSTSTEDFFTNLLSIRYEGSRPTFERRNHFPEIDWIPNNIKTGILDDITAEVAQKAAIKPGVEHKLIDKEKWLAQLVRTGKVSKAFAAAALRSWKSRSLASDDQAEVKYIPLKEISRAVAHIPDGSVINLVRRNDERKFVLITHQGLLIREGGAVILRHALPNGRIMNVKLVDYLERLAAGESRMPPLLGINVNHAL